MPSGNTKLPNSIEKHLRDLIQELQLNKLELERRHEELLRSHEALHKRFVSLYDCAPLGCLSVNGAGAILEANLTIAALLKVERSELIGQQLCNFILSDDWRRFVLVDERIFGANEPQVCELQLRTSKDESFWARFETSLVQNGTSGLPVLDIVISDLSEKKRLEAALVENTQRFRTLADSGMALVWTSDTTKSCDYFNEPWLNFTGRTLEQEMGDGWLEGVHPEDLDNCMQTYVTAFDKRERFSIEYRLRHASGEYRWLQDVGAPRYDATGTFLGYIGHSFDVTERIKAEGLVRLLSVAIEQSPAVIIIANREGEIEYVNPMFTTLTGYAREEAVGKNPRILKSGETPPERYEDLWQTILSGHTWQGEFYNKKKTGELYWEEVKISPVFDEKRIITHFLAIKEDISSRKLAEEEKKAFQARLIQTEKMTSLGLMASGVAHEINNPNNYIMFNAELLAKVWQSVVPLLEAYFTEHGDFKLGSFRYSETHEIIPLLFSGLVDGSERIKKIVENMQTFSQMDGILAKVDVNEVVIDAVSLLSHEIKKYCRNLELESEENLPRSLCNPQQIAQVLINLIMNALQSLPDKTHSLRIRTLLKDNGDYISIVVEDEGKGMSQEVLDHIAEPFFTTNADQGGAGLGLYISKSIIEQNQGSLNFISTPGKGTIATIDLPVHRVENLEIT